MDTNYFVCTLGQAAALRKTQNDYKDINQFIDRQAERVGQQPAVGFFRPSSAAEVPWQHRIFNFKDIQRGSQVVAELLSDSADGGLSEKQTVALLCPSSAGFLLVWLALMRLGHSVLLLAPQCQPSAIAHLCKTCNVSYLFHDDVYQDQAKASVQLLKEQDVTLHSVALSSVLSRDIFSLVEDEPKKHEFPPALEETAVAYLHHTSGTSTGLPKPIPQSHRAGCGVLPCLPEDSHKATFTTTPLYHGGIADLFRAWTSNALIWLFPGKEAPITAANICRCLNLASESTRVHQTPQICYFSSVPYVLQMMEADEQGMQYLTNMDIVGVGGAALPAEVGDRLVQKGVNLISRFGSAECGFIMSSHRDYTKDKGWQYLRSQHGAEALKFEPQDDGTSELVIMPGWPHMAKTNRPDGSFATADLFVPHPDIERAWRYHSRADSQLTLITGKKFDPAPLESAIAASSLLSDALIFGNGKPFPGVLLFRSKESADMSDAQLVESISPIIRKLNSESQDHARIPLRMLKAMPYKENNLEKSSKGTILRNKAEERYADNIESAYSDSGAVSAGDVSDENVPKFLLETVESIVAKPAKLREETDLFAYGVDSVACMQIRYIMQQLLPGESKDLPLSIVEDCGTVRRLSEYVVKRRHGEVVSNEDDGDEHKLMLGLVKKYSEFEDHSSSNPGYVNEAPKDGDIVVLTGATGALGAHILDLYRKSAVIRKIYCLVRGADEHAARERVSKALEQRGLSNLSDSSVRNSEVHILHAQLGEARLGLDDETYNLLAREATIIMHIAWSVNFRMRLRHFEKDNIAGVHNLLNLALQSPHEAPPKFAYCSSVASALSYTGKGKIPEQILNDPSTASPLGYSRSKWVAEQICAQAHNTTRLQNRVAVFRVGQLSGDSKTGIWNTKEAWPMMLSTVKLTKSLPALQNEPLNWLPVDLAAEAFIEAAAHMEQSEEATRVYHVLNEHKTPDWMKLLEWLKKMEKFETVSPQEWVEQLEGMEREAADHPAMKLLGHWKKAYGSEKDPADATPLPEWDMQRTKQAAPVLRDVHPVDEEYFQKIWDWLQSSM